MLNFQNHAQPDNVSPFYGDVTNRYYARESHFLFVYVFGNYVNLVNNIFRNNMRLGWTSVEIKNLSTLTKILKNDDRCAPKSSGVLVDNYKILPTKPSCS